MSYINESVVNQMFIDYKNRDKGINLYDIFFPL